MKRRELTPEEREDWKRNQEELMARMLRDDLTPEQLERYRAKYEADRTDGLEAFDELLRKAAQPKK